MLKLHFRWKNETPVDVPKDTRSSLHCLNTALLRNKNTLWHVTSVWFTTRLWHILRLWHLTKTHYSHVTVHSNVTYHRYYHTSLWLWQQCDAARATCSLWARLTDCWWSELRDSGRSAEWRQDRTGKDRISVWLLYTWEVMEVICRGPHWSQWLQNFETPLLLLKHSGECWNTLMSVAMISFFLLCSLLQFLHGRWWRWPVENPTGYTHWLPSSRNLNWSSEFSSYSLREGFKTKQRKVWPLSILASHPT